jgi:hypothetical protein
MEQSPSWEANQFSPSQEIPLILLNGKVHYRIHNCPPPVPILSQLDPVHTPTSHLLKIHLNIIPPFTPVLPSRSFPQVSPSNNCIRFSSPPYARHVPSISFFSILPPAQYWVRNTDHSAPHYVTFSIPLGPNTLLNTLFSNTLSLRSSLNVSDQVSHPYKTTGKIIVLYILISKFLVRNLEDKRYWTE